MKTSPIIKQIERDVGALQRKLLGAVREGANEMLLRYPFIDDYDQGMGSATFNISLFDHSFMINISDDDPLHDAANYLAIHEVSIEPQALRQLERFKSDCLTLQKYHDAWSDYFTGSLAGEPLSLKRRSTTKPTWPLS